MFLFVNVPLRNQKRFSSLPNSVELKIIYLCANMKFFMFHLFLRMFDSRPKRVSRVTCFKDSAAMQFDKFRVSDLYHLCFIAASEANQTAINFCSSFSNFNRMNCDIFVLFLILVDVVNSTELSQNN